MGLHQDTQTVMFVRFIFVSVVKIKLCTMFSSNTKRDDIKKF